MPGKNKESEQPITSGLKTHFNKRKEQFKKLCLITNSHRRKLTKQQTLVVIGLIALLTLGALGAAANPAGKNSGSDWGILSSIARTLGLSDSEEESTEPLANPANGTLQLSKEYIYAGSRMLAVEDYGLSGTSATPTPTPTPATPTPTPATPTPTPATPTPTPTVASCPTGYNSLGGHIASNPATAVFNNNLYVFVKGTEGAIYYRKTADGSNFDSYVNLGGYLVSDPRTFISFNALYVEATGGDNQPYLRSTGDGANFDNWIGASINAQTSASSFLSGNTYSFVKGGGTEPPLCMKAEAGGNPAPAPPGPSITSVTQNTDPACLNLTLNAVPGASSYDVKILDSGHTINVTNLSFPWCGLQGGTYYEYQARAVNGYGASGWSATAGGTTAAPAQTNNSSPAGALENINGNLSLTVTGWSYDPDNPSASNDVHIYIDGPAGVGTGYVVTANQPRADVNQAQGITGNHGFSFQIPAQYLLSSQHEVYAYGIDLGTNSNSLLSGSPLSFGAACNPSSSQLNRCTQLGGSWDYDTCKCQYGQSGNTEEENSSGGFWETITTTIQGWWS